MLLDHMRWSPVRDDDAVIAAALDDASIPALVAAVVHLTGDPSIIRRPLRPRGWDIQGFREVLTDEERALLRREALGAVCAWRDAGCPTPTPLPDELALELMAWITGRPIPDDYAALYLEEMDLAGRNPRAIEVPEAAPRRVSALIIGCGESGLLAALRLHEAGIPFTVLEKNHDVGGAWLENHYPGCRVDVASHYYSYSFGPNDEFSEYFARQPELHRYFRRFVEDRGVAERVRWGCEVERAMWEEDDARWHVTFRNAVGQRETLAADVLISGVGILNRPLIPDIPGLDRFPGPVFHSARWDDDVDLTAKRVALIGAGASGFQIAPAIADDVERLVVFQRTAQWMAPNARYHQAISDGERWALRHLPGYGRWYRFLLLWQASDKLLELVRADPTWPDFPRTANARSAERREDFVAWIAANVGDDFALAAKVTPDYPPMAKRMLQDNGSWLQCLQRPQVDLVTDEIVEVDGHAVVTAAQRHDVDVIVLATGFRANEVLWPMEIIGRSGKSLTETWNGRPVGYLGISVPDFPNFFMLGGPGSGLAHAGSMIFISECQMRYVGDAIRLLLEGHRSIEPSTAAFTAYEEAQQAEVETLMWGHPSIEHSWYKAPDGRVYVLCPWRLVDYWKMTARVDLADHLVVGEQHRTTEGDAA